MKIDFTDKERVRHSPYYMSNQLWDKIDSSIQTSKTMLEFSNKLRVIDLSKLFVTVYNINVALIVPIMWYIMCITD